MAGEHCRDCIGHDRHYRIERGEAITTSCPGLPSRAEIRMEDARVVCKWCYANEPTLLAGRRYYHFGGVTDCDASGIHALLEKEGKDGSVS